MALLFPRAASGTLRHCSGSRGVWSSLHGQATEATALGAKGDLALWPVTLGRQAPPCPALPRLEAAALGVPSLGFIEISAISYTPKQSKGRSVTRQLVEHQATSSHVDSLAQRPLLFSSRPLPSALPSLITSTGAAVCGAGATVSARSDRPLYSSCRPLLTLTSAGPAGVAWAAGGPGSALPFAKALGTAPPHLFEPTQLSRCCC